MSHVKISVASLRASTGLESDELRSDGVITTEDMKTPEFQSREFDESSVHGFPIFLQEVVAAALGVTIIIIEGWQSWLLRALQHALPRFPLGLLDHLGNNDGVAMLPSFRNNDEFWFMMEHVNLASGTDRTYNKRSWRLGFAEIQRVPLATWTYLHGAFDVHPEKPVVVICAEQDQHIQEQLEEHYASSGGFRRWNRLNTTPAWIYMDLFYIFTKWDRTWEAARRSLEPMERQLYGFDPAAPILRQTRMIHKDTATTLALRESVRLHAASLKRFSECVIKLPITKELKSLQDRLYDVSQLLEYYETTSLTILEQQQNLLSLTFNIETVTQGQAVARINALAFIFLPLSFVASLFGMTTFEVSAYLYPAVAVPVLISTIIAALSVNKVIGWYEKQESFLAKIKQSWNPHTEAMEHKQENTSTPSGTQARTERSWRQPSAIFARETEMVPLSSIKYSLKSAFLSPNSANIPQYRVFYEEPHYANNLKGRSSQSDYDTRSRMVARVNVGDPERGPSAGQVEADDIMGDFSGFQTWSRHK